MTTTTSATSALSSYVATQTSALSTTSTSTSSSSSLISATGDLTTFLKILTTQLQNQDPTNTTDTDQFTQELVQFAGVEQQINTNTKLDDILAQIKSNGITPLLSYVGQTVEVTTGDNTVLVQDGTAEFSYTLDDAATSVTMKIKDSSGNTVATLTGTGSEGKNLVSWDGKDSDGKAVDDGSYTVTITAKNSSGDSLKATNVSYIGVVSGISTDSDGTTTLSVGDQSVDPSDVTSVYAGVTTTSSSTTSSSSTST